LELSAVDAVHKLHPHNYAAKTATNEWLIAACLRQNKFVMTFPYHLLSFKVSYKKYL
jgi:hypothetical protein